MQIRRLKRCQFYLGLGRRPEEEMATHFSVLAWKTPWAKEPGGLQSMGLQKSPTRLSEHDHGWFKTTEICSFKKVQKLQVWNQGAVKVLISLKSLREDPYFFLSSAVCWLFSSFLGFWMFQSNLHLTWPLLSVFLCTNFLFLWRVSCWIQTYSTTL